MLKDGNLMAFQNGLQDRLNAYFFESCAKVVKM